MNQKYISFYFFFALLLPIFYISSSGGRNDNRAGAPNDQSTCGLCHSGSGNGTVNLTGLPTSYAPGVTYPLSLTVSETGASALTQIVAGFQIVASNGITGQMQGAFTEGVGTRKNFTDRLVQDAPLAYDMNDEAQWDFSWTAPLTGPSEVIFYYAANSADNNGSTSGDITYFNTTSSLVLPVVWSYFEFAELGGRHILSWGTESEDNSHYFDIQMSVNGQRFENLHRESAQGFSHVSQHYEYSFLPRDVKKVFYRLKQVDIDGRFSYSDILQVQLSSRIKVYPTHFNQEITISGGEGPLDIELYDVQGNRVLSSSNQHVIQTAFLSQGSYFLNVLNEYGQIVKQAKMLKL